MAERQTGVVSKVMSNRQYGFIRPDDDVAGRDAFFHNSDFVDGSNPQVRARVTFLLVRGQRGLRARNVRKINAAG